MKPFKRRRRGGIVATFEAGEAHVLASLAAQVVELLRDRNGAGESDPDPLAAQLGIGGPGVPPEDPVLQRLLPDAYPDDPDDAAEFRKYTERSLTSTKVANAETLLAGLAAAGLDDADGDQHGPIEVELDRDAAQCWVRALTDVRLALAVRLGIESDEDALRLSRSDDSSTAAMTELYDWLGYVQESLVGALT